jgi:hypothetical protein
MECFFSSSVVPGEDYTEKAKRLPVRKHLSTIVPLTAKSPDTPGLKITLVKTEEGIAKGYPAVG